MTELVVPIPLPPRLARLTNRAPTPPLAGTAARPGWEIRNAAGDQGDTAELLIYDDIGGGGWYGGGVSPDSFATALQQITTPNLTVRLNSPGGDVFDGITIANLIRSHPAAVTVAVDGLAASIASVIAMAGDKIVMGPQAQMMIHDAMGSVWGGNPADMRDMADLLDRQSDNIAAAYRQKAGGMAKSWRTRMQAETWYSADEAVAAGLADSVGTVPTATGPSPTTTNPNEGYDDWWDRSTKTFDLAARFHYSGRGQAPAPGGLGTRARELQAVHDRTVYPGEEGPEPVVINVSPDLALTVTVLDAQQTRAAAGVDHGVDQGVDGPPGPIANNDGFEIREPGILDPRQLGDAIAAAQPTDVETPGPADAVDDPQEPAVDAQETAPPETDAPDLQDWAAATAHLLKSPADSWAAATAHLIGA